MIEAYIIHLLILACIYVILSISLQLNIGFTGNLNLGHIGFYAIGAYVSALTAMAGYPFPTAFLAGGIAALCAGYVLSVPLGRLEGDYLALATLGFSFVVYAAALNLTDITHGPLGIAGIPKPEFLGISFADNGAFLALAVVVATGTYLVIRRIVRSPFGRVLAAVRDDELAARCLGKNASKAKSLSLAIGALFAGFAGSLYAHYITYIDPFSFTILELIPILAMVIIGGLGSLEGTALAAVLLTLLPEPLRFIGMPSSIIGPGRQMIFAALLLLVLIYRPKGLGGRVQLK